MQPKLKKRLFMLLVVLTLVGTMTAIMTLANLAPSEPFLSVWISSFAWVSFVLLPIGACLFTTLTKLFDHFFPSWSDLQKNLLQGILMAVIMEALMAVITTLNSHPYHSLAQFSDFVFTSLFYALPLGLCFSCFMSLVIKPKLQRHLTKVSI
ncbi:hypothetical protein [uncultured Paraglaciecola sp.]|uniref:hypothetical protein n=1 Tax=uncultured Paraglaciecola sp. TaxID=1765024 RepID=UPI0030D78E83